MIDSQGNSETSELRVVVELARDMQQASSTFLWAKVMKTQVSLEIVWASSDVALFVLLFMKCYKSELV